MRAIKVVEATDAATLSTIHATAFDAPWDEAAIAGLLGQAGVFGLADAAADAFILCRVVLDEAEILTLAVRPTARRKRLGARLVEDAAATAVQFGAERLFLEVAEDNAPARALYEGLGFLQTGRRRGYYDRGVEGAVDALLFTLTLTQPLPTA